MTSTDTDTHRIVGSEQETDVAATGGLRERIVRRAQRLAGGRTHPAVIELGQATPERMEAEPNTAIRLTDAQVVQLREIEAAAELRSVRLTAGRARPPA